MIERGGLRALRSGGLRIRRGAVLLVALAATTSCSGPPLPGAAELEPLSPRTVQSEVLAALPTGQRPEGEGVLNGHRLDRYFVDGGWVEVLWVEAVGGVEGVSEVRQSVNPVIFRDGGLDGWGWEHFDERATVWGIPPFESSEEVEASESPDSPFEERTPGPSAGTI